ncbi:MAG: glutamate--tRNA ligase [Micavibrio aeruginosavorus]|uniref:Glutamate--tRNA ligase n=1 Tax=Micavibrio aeruginosavorus TaxID=349221 RepID=A0A2W5FM89_9BACT|nr:MAG: glutamate--tRNA ligase [Micavibrio aeruginosavorus]
MTVITRFPPSPTGFMHIGTARTALFNWLYAKHTGGKMTFRIEDTDRERHSEEAVEALIRGMQWLGLDWDGEIVSQYARRERHQEIAEQLVKDGKAYYCYCTPDELEEMRAKAMAVGSNQFYDRRWRDSKETPPADIKPVIRIKAPLEGESIVHDEVQGEVKVSADHLDDFIILRSDGVPTYMLAVVVDDHDMGITHVIRGDDHLNNTFRQNIIYAALDWTIPVYAHIPLILDESGAKMSKRKGAASVEEYRDMGYLPEAMCNYILKLGWGHGDDEIISREQAIEWFDLGGIVKSPARWDYNKLNFINAHYLKLADNDRLYDLALPFLKTQPNAEEKSRVLKMMDELKSRHKTIVQIADEAEIMIGTISSYDEKARAQFTEEGLSAIRKLLEKISALSKFESGKIETMTKELSQSDFGGKLGKVMMPFRAALTGRGVSPSVPHIAEALGKEETIRRLEAALQKA